MNKDYGRIFPWYITPFYTETSSQGIFPNCFGPQHVKNIDEYWYLTMAQTFLPVSLANHTSIQSNNFIYNCKFIIQSFVFFPKWLLAGKWNFHTETMLQEFATTAGCNFDFITLFFTSLSVFDNKMLKSIFKEI